MANAWDVSDVQGRKEDRTIAGATASEAAANNDDNGSQSAGSAARGRGFAARGRGSAAFSTYTHYSYLCAPPGGVWVDLKNGIELQRLVDEGAGGGGGGDSSRKGRTVTTTFTRRCVSWRANGPAHLNYFIDMCVNAYNADLRSKVKGVGSL